MNHKNHEWQLTNLKLSRQLKELGVPQESLWYWTLVQAYESVTGKDEWVLEYGQEHGDTISAFTVAEHGEALLRGVKCWKWERKDKIIAWVCCNPISENHIDGDTESNTKAKIRIYLIENKLI